MIRNTLKKFSSRQQLNPTIIRENVKYRGHYLILLLPQSLLFYQIEMMLSLSNNLVGNMNLTSENELFYYIHDI